MPRTPKTPQEKKKLSLKKDRRNAFRANAKASRAAIPLRKAEENRRNRHKQNQALATVDAANDASVDLAESSARRDVYRAGGWTKFPDQPLARHIESKVAGRAKRAGRRSNSPHVK